MIVINSQEALMSTIKVQQFSERIRVPSPDQYREIVTYIGFYYDFTNHLGNCRITLHITDFTNGLTAAAWELCVNWRQKLSAPARLLGPTEDPAPGCAGRVRARSRHGRQCTLPGVAVKLMNQFCCDPIAEYFTGERIFCDKLLRMVISGMMKVCLVMKLILLVQIKVSFLAL